MPIRQVFSIKLIFKILCYIFNYIYYREARYRRPNIAEFTKKTYAISRFLAKILQVPISPNFLSFIHDCQIIDCVLCMIAFGGVFNSTQFGDSLLWFTICEPIVTILIILKINRHMTSFRTPARFSFFEPRILFLSPYPLFTLLLISRPWLGNVVCF
jgi:hypothetical protein